MQSAKGSDHLRIGVMECLVPFLTERLAQVDIALSVHVGNTETLVEQLRKNKIDVILAFNVPRLPELRVHDERSYELGVVYAPDLTPLGAAPFKLEDCVHLPLCLPDTSMSVWPRLDAEIYRVHAEPRIVLRTNSIALLTDYVAKGAGISFLTSLDAAAGLQSGQFRFGKISNRRLSERLFLCSALNAPLQRGQSQLATALFKSIP